MNTTSRVFVNLLVSELMTAHITAAAAAESKRSNKRNHTGNKSVHPKSSIVSNVTSPTRFSLYRSRYPGSARFTQYYMVTRTDSRVHMISIEAKKSRRSCVCV